ncbi:MAG: sodium/glutamate symporter [Pseudobdellovibrionaceae bacterium]
MFEISALQTLGMAAAVIMFGRILVQKIGFFDKYNFPAPVVGGLIVAIVLFILKKNQILHVKFDLAFQEALMIGFFASLGFGASWIALRAGGKSVISFLIICIGVLLLQNILGVFAARLLGEPDLKGILAGSVALAGGPGTSLAFAPLFEQAGIADAKTFGLACALGGILMGGIFGPPLGTYLIRKHSLKSSGVKAAPPVDARLELGPTKDFSFNANVQEPEVNLLKHILGLIIVLGLGTIVSHFIKQTGITLPIYIGSMFVAAIARNIDDKFSTFRLNEKLIDEIGSICLSLFIAASVMNLDLAQLQAGAFSLFFFLFVQALMVIVLSVTVIYWWTGKDFDAAVTSAGFAGFMLGTMANAMVNMNALTQKFGPARKAYLVVPIVGACFIDFANAAFITFSINFLK